MFLTEPEFHLALLQLQELADLYGKDSAVVRAAQAFNRRRKTMKKNLKLFFRRLRHKPAERPDGRLKMLVHVRGGIGDVCMTRLLVSKLRQRFPKAQLDFCYDHEAVVKMVFSDGMIDQYVSRDYDPQEYDLVMAGCHAFNFDQFDEVRLRRLAPEWLPALERARALQEKLQVVTQNTPHLDGIWAKISMAYGSTRIQNMGLTTGISVEQDDRAPLPLDAQKLRNILAQYGLEGKRYITIHDGTNTNTDLKGRAATRCWPRANWEQFGRLFKRKFPDICLVQLGGSNSAPFDFADVCLVGKTTVDQLPYLLEGAILHLDGESGMVHLANLTSTRAVVMFGPSPLNYLAYSRNINLRAGSCRDCMCIYADWMSRCALFDTNRCLHAITPQRVLDAIEHALEEEK